MGCCCSRLPNQHQRSRERFIPCIRPISPPIRIISDVESINSDISCNFVYNDGEDNLFITIAAVLSILAVSTENDYNVCIICFEYMSTLQTTICHHKVLCSQCYLKYCIQHANIKCPLCRTELDIDNPFEIC